jgi:hypothetical protein
MVDKNIHKLLSTITTFSSYDIALGCYRDYAALLVIIVKKVFFSIASKSEIIVGSSIMYHIYVMFHSSAIVQLRILCMIFKTVMTS